MNPQDYNGQPYQGQPYQGQGYNGQPYQGQGYNGQPYQGQGYNGQPNQGQGPYYQQNAGQTPYGANPYGGNPMYGMGQQNQPMPMRPDNNMVWAILSTLCCCLPFGIVSIVYAAKVNGLYNSGQFQAAYKAASDAKKWALISAVCGLALNIIYFVYLMAVGGTAALSSLQYA